MEDDSLYGENQPEGTTTEDQLEKHYDEIFDFIDSNDDNLISRTELEKYAQLHGYNPTGQEMNDFYTEKNLTEESTLDRKDFEALAGDLLGILADPTESLRNALDEADLDNNGQLNKDEFKAFLTTKGDNPLTEEEVEELFSELKAEDEDYIEREKLEALLTAKPHLEQ